MTTAEHEIKPPVSLLDLPYFINGGSDEDQPELERWKFHIVAGMKPECSVASFPEYQNHPVQITRPIDALTEATAMQIFKGVLIGLCFCGHFEFVLLVKSKNHSVIAQQLYVEKEELSAPK